MAYVEVQLTLLISTLKDVNPFPKITSPLATHWIIESQWSRAHEIYDPSDTLLTAIETSALK